MNPCFETATRLARAIRNGRLSSVEATRAHLDRIERVNGPLNALVLVDEAGAMRAARAADRVRGQNKPLGPLHGVPITIKEAFDVAGLKTTSSHPPLADNVAREDASVVARLRAAGAVILGKTRRLHPHPGRPLWDRRLQKHRPARAHRGRPAPVDHPGHRLRHDPLGA